MINFADLEAMIFSGNYTDKEYGRYINWKERMEIRGWWDSGYGDNWEASHSGLIEGYDY